MYESLNEKWLNDANKAVFMLEKILADINRKQYSFCDNFEDIPERLEKAIHLLVG